MAAEKTKHCVDCDALFAPSRNDYTVRCPECRANRVVAKVSKANDMRKESAYWEAKIAAMNARRDFTTDSDEYRAAFANYQAAAAARNA